MDIFCVVRMIMIATTLVSYFTYGLLMAVFCFFNVKQIALCTTSELIEKRSAVWLIADAVLWLVVFVLLPLTGGQSPGVFTSALWAVCIRWAFTINIPLIYAMIWHYTLPCHKKTLFESPQASISRQSVPANHRKDSKSNAGCALSISKCNDQEQKTNKPIQKQRPSIELAKSEFESYFRKYKPYLNPKLTINELAIQFGTNRAYLSRYVNTTYRMNFCSYINQYRLAEYEKIKSDPSNATMSELELVEKAGFSDYRACQRVKKREKKVVSFVDPISLGK